MSWKHPGKVAITFRDVAAYFTEVEWKRLQENQKEFYKKVMKEIHQTLIFLGYKIANPDTLVRITKGKEPHIWEANESGRRIYNNEPSSFCHRAVGPDIFLRIKEEPLCGAKSSDEELEVSSRPSKANNTSTNSSIIHWRKRAEKLSSCDFQDAKASEREAGLNSADADVSNAAVLPKIKREAKFPLKGCQDIEIGRSKAGHKAANYTSDSSNVQYMIKREKKPSGKGSEGAKSKTDLSKEILFVRTDICSGETEESNPFVVAQPDGKDAQHGTSPSSGYEVISFPIKEEEEDYPLNHPFFESRGRIAPSAGFGKRKAADSIHSHQDNLQEEESELYNDFESALSDSEILSFQLNTDQQCGLLYTCAECDKNFTSKESLMIHLRTHAVDKPYPCAKCDKSFSLKRNLKRHQRTHIEENERRYRCDECEKTFCQKDSLVKHKRTHTGERPYHCTECDKRFSVRVNLITHQRIHSSERPYQCTQCDKSFTQKAHLIGHEAKHTGVRPYQCSKCDKSYSFQGSLIRHQSSHTGNAGSTTAAKEKAPKKQQI